MAELTEDQIKALVTIARQLTWGDNILLYEHKWKDLAASAVTSNHDADKVGPGRIRVITHMAAYNDVTANPFIYLRHHDGAEYLVDEGQVAPAIGEVVRFSGFLILREGQREGVSFETCSSGDDIYFVSQGYEILLKE